MGPDGPKWGQEDLFPTNPDLPDILGDMDFDFENLYFFGFFWVYVGFHRVITCVICVITRFCVITHVIALQRVKRYIRVI